MTAPIDIDCPRCKVTAGRFCISIDGRAATLDYHHAERVDEAIRVNERRADARFEAMAPLVEVRPSRFAAEAELIALWIPIDNVPLETRTRNVLASFDVRYLGDVATRVDEYSLLKSKNYGRKSHRKLRSVLAAVGLRFGFKASTEWMQARDAIEADLAKLRKLVVP